jgi:hypothetical protein
MKERPIIFSGPMLKAILEDRKTMTRRPIKPQPELIRGEGFYQRNKRMLWNQYKFEDDFIRERCPYGQTGDRLWVRETWWKSPFITSKMFREGADTWPEIIYDGEDNDFEQWKKWGWKRMSSIFISRSASRINLEILNVRIERVEEITEEDAVKEGYPLGLTGAGMKMMNGRSWFSQQWARIYGFHYDPKIWVWVIEFKNVKPG